uniref:Uncharacterized protein n=1 Tax=Meloidogyne floridensis TaxID=298350 RepID=A0A915P8D4_9BILA
MCKRASGQESNLKAFFRRNSRHLRRLSRLYDWEVDEFGSFRPVIPITQNQRFLRQIKGENEEKLEIKINNQQQQQICANDSYILDKLLINYNRHKIPGGKVEVMVEVWVQEITTISDITSDFQAIRHLYQRNVEGGIKLWIIHGWNLANISL